MYVYCSAPHLAQARKLGRLGGILVFAAVYRLIIHVTRVYVNLNFIFFRSQESHHNCQSRTVVDTIHIIIPKMSIIVSFIIYSIFFDDFPMKWNINVDVSQVLYFRQLKNKVLAMVIRQSKSRHY